MKQRYKTWGILFVIAIFLVLWGNRSTAEEVQLQTISVNVPLAMQSSFERILKVAKLNKKYEIKFTDEEANFTVSIQNSNNNKLIAYSPVVAIFNEDEELYQSYIEKEIFVPSDTEPKEYDFDFQKIMKDIIENQNSNYKVYYPDDSICDWDTFYAFLLYTINDGCYPSAGTNMEECQELVSVFLQSKNTESISRDSLNKIKGFAKNSIYFIPLADIGYIYEENTIPCRVMYPETVVYCNYYASADETGKILFDALEYKDTGFFSTGYTGYWYLNSWGNYFVEQYGTTVTIFYSNGRVSHFLPGVRDCFNAVEAPD